MKKLCILLSTCLISTVIPLQEASAKSLENDNSIVISQLESWDDAAQVINKDVYVSKDASLYISSDTIVNGDIYNLGTIMVSTDVNLTINGTLNTLRYVSFKPTIISEKVPGYDYGHFQSSGILNIQTLNISDNYINIQIPEIEEPSEPEEPNEPEAPVEPDIPATIYCDATMVLNKNDNLKNVTISKDIYIPKDFKLNTSETVTICGDVYVFGTLSNSGNLNVTGTINCLHYGSAISAGDYDYGYLTSTGKITAGKLNVTDSFLQRGIPAFIHRNMEWLITQNATCVKNGLTEKKCSACGECMESQLIPATGHSLGSWKTQKKATIFSNGTQTRKCQYCGYTQSRTIKKLTSKVTLSKKSLTLIRKDSSSILKMKSFTKGDSISTWTSSNPKIVSVNKKTGKLSAKSKGIATITLKMKSGAKASCKVKVESPKLNKTKLVLKSKKSASLKISGTSQKITWTSSNKKVATVSSSGKIKAKKKGVTVITAKIGSQKFKCKVTVK